MHGASIALLSSAGIGAEGDVRELQLSDVIMHLTQRRQLRREIELSDVIVQLRQRSQLTQVKQSKNKGIRLTFLLNRIKQNKREFKHIEQNKQNKHSNIQ